MRLPCWLARSAAQQERVASLLLAPVSTGVVEGVLVAVHAESGAFNRSHLDRARTVGPILGAAITSAHTWSGRVAETRARALASEARGARLQHQHEVLVAAMDTAVLMASAGDRIVLANPAFLRLFGRADARSLEGLRHADLASELSDLFAVPGDFLGRTARASGAPDPTFDELPLADGRVLECTSRPVLDADGRVGRLWSYRDVTERVSSARALAAALADMERVDRQRQQMLGQISHEIRSPIQSILAMTEALRQADLPPEEADLVHAVRGASAQVTHMLTELLDLSRLASGTLRIERLTVDLGEVVEEVVESLGPGASGRGLWLRVAVDGDLGPLHTDPDRVRQVVTNLISNAIKYTTAGGVTVRVDRDGDHGCIDVTDTGPGLTAAQRKGLFAAYAQVRGTTSAAKGVGLGLHISQRLVDRLGGTIDVDSTLGQGTTFRVRLPGATPRGAPPPHRKQRIATVGFCDTRARLLHTQLAGMGLLASPGARTTHIVLPADSSPPARAVDDTRIALIAAAPANGPTPTRADAVLRGPLTRSALERALRRCQLRQETEDLEPATERIPVPPGRVLEIIIAADDDAIRRLLRHFIARVQPTPHIRLAEHGAQAVAHYRTRPADIVLIDSDMPVLDGSGAAWAIRAFEADHPSVPPALIVPSPVTKTPTGCAGWPMPGSTGSTPSRCRPPSSSSSSRRTPGLQSTPAGPTIANFSSMFRERCAMSGAPVRVMVRAPFASQRSEGHP